MLFGSCKSPNKTCICSASAVSILQNPKKLCISFTNTVYIQKNLGYPWIGYEIAFSNPQNGREDVYKLCKHSLLSEKPIARHVWVGSTFCLMQKPKGLGYCLISLSRIVCFVQRPGKADKGSTRTVSLLQRPSKGCIGYLQALFASCKRQRSCA